MEIERDKIYLITFLLVSSEERKWVVFSLSINTASIYLCLFLSGEVLLKILRQNGNFRKQYSAS